MTSTNNDIANMSADDLEKILDEEIGAAQKAQSDLKAISDTDTDTVDSVDDEKIFSEELKSDEVEQAQMSTELDSELDSAVTGLDEVEEDVSDSE